MKSLNVLATRVDGSLAIVAIENFLVSFSSDIFKSAIVSTLA